MTPRPPPRRGARIELARAHVDEREVRYDASAASDDARSVGVARVSLGDGAVSLELEPAVDPALHAFVVAVLRRAWANRRDEPTPWPARITRWRP